METWEVITSFVHVPRRCAALSAAVSFACPSTDASPKLRQGDIKTDQTSRFSREAFGKLHGGDALLRVLAAQDGSRCFDW